MGDASGLKDWVLLIAGNIFVIFLVARAVGYYARREWGEMIGHLLAGVLVAGLVYSTDATVNLLKEAWQKLIG